MTISTRIPESTSQVWVLSSKYFRASSNSALNETQSLPKSNQNEEYQ